jgi:hypothetical protein
MLHYCRFKKERNESKNIPESVGEIMFFNTDWIIMNITLFAKAR